MKYVHDESIDTHRLQVRGIHRTYNSEGGIGQISRQRKITMDQLEALAAGCGTCRFTIPLPYPSLSHALHPRSSAGEGTLSGRARGVPFAKSAKHVAVLATAVGGVSIALLDTAKTRIEAGLNLGGDNSDTVTFDRVQPISIESAPQGFDQNTLMLMGGVARSLQIAGALESMLDISVRYSNERVAFEKKISKFQAVQHILAKLAGESAAALTAATSAASRSQASPTRLFDPILMTIRRDRPSRARTAASSKPSSLPRWIENCGASRPASVPRSSRHTTWPKRLA